MKTQHHIITAALAASCFSALAADLAPQTLACESSDAIAFAKRTDGLKGRPADKALAGAAAHLKMNDLMKEFAATQRRLANQESAIAGTRYARSADQNAKVAEASADRDTADSAMWTSIVQTCATTGAESLHADIIEKKPISGIAKVKVMLNGQSAEVFVPMESVVE